MEGDAKKSICQIRGVPHPHACAFVSDAPNLLAIAGWDADGNGVLLMSEFAADEEARRVGYHVLCRSSLQDESEEARRRRRMRGWTPEVPQTPEGGRLLVGERLEVLEQGMEQIQFEETDEFVAVNSIRPPTEEPPISSDPPQSEQVSDKDIIAPEDVLSQSAVRQDEPAQGTIVDSSTVGDSVRTEPLDDPSESTEDYDQ